ncbi:MAG TPA: NADH-quinone oxidoreductase subunit M [Rhodocyclaceae bacterium]|nr:NADH-quinone oxidoreductase subunit M [Rhodocyclaceae bacterium]
MLSILLAIPLLGALLIAAIPGRQTVLIQRLALAASVAALAYASWLLSRFDASSAAIQFAESYTWNPRLGARFAFGVDAFSLPLLLLTTLLTVVTILASCRNKGGTRLYFFLVLVLESAILGVFSARDWSLFYVFWELTLIPLFFLIDRLGGPQRQRAALNFVLYTLGGSVFMLIALLFMYDAAPGHSFDMSAMADMAEGGRQLPLNMQLLIFAGLFLGFGVKMPVFPLHGWLRLAYTEAPIFIPIILSGVMAKMGAYGLLRAAEALPEAMAAASGGLAIVAVISMLYGGVLAWRQRDVKAMIAYSSMSHMGVVLLGIATLNAAGFAGTVVQMVSHGLVAGLLFLIVGLIHERRAGRDLLDLDGLGKRLPRLKVFFVLALLASVGLPGTAGFIAELHILIGGFARWSFLVMMLGLSVLLSAAYALRTISHLLASNSVREHPPAPDMNRGELIGAGILASAVVAIGVLPGPLLALVNVSASQLAHRFGY